MTKTLFTALLSLLAITAVAAQDLPVSPTPQHITLTGSKAADFSTAAKTTVKTTINPKAAAKAGLPDVPGAYRLTISGDKATIKVKITAADARGAHYARLTLDQLKKAGSCPSVDISDYPTLPLRGTVEGFYGTPWSHEVRLSLIDFLGRFKMNTYVYGPKDDPYHRTPSWREPYPEADAARIRELTEACSRNFVDFIWAIHPGGDIRWNEEDYRHLIDKFQQMYDLGVRGFAVFFDDIEGEGTDPSRQVALLNRINREFIRPKGDISTFIVCPTDYSRLWAIPGPYGPLSVYGRELDPDIHVFWTGDFVCSDLTAETLSWVDSRIQRPALYWWNFPVTDYARHIIMLGPAYGLESGLTGTQTAGVLSNPMEHGEASKLALYGVADYSWNTSAYRPLDNWKRAIAELVPEAPDAFRAFAIHSCDTETGYRRSESWSTETVTLSDHSPSSLAALEADLHALAAAPQTLRSSVGNALLLAEIDPWLTEAEALAERCLGVVELIRMYDELAESAAAGGVDPNAAAEFREKYSANLMTPEQREAFAAHKLGTVKLQPFYERAMEELGAAFHSLVSGSEAAGKD